MDEHVLQNNSDLQMSSSTLEGSFSYVAHLAENTFYQQNMLKALDYDSYSVPQWVGYPQMAPYYAEYLAGNGISNTQSEISYDSTGIGCSFTPEESFLSMDVHQVSHSRPQHEEVPVNNFKSTQHEICYQKQGPNEGIDTSVQHQPNMSTLTSGIRTRSRKAYARQKATDSDRRRRTRIATALDALEDLLPQSKGNKANIVDDCIDYIKYLQLQMKELSQSRLVGEPTSNHLTYLEGYGHYLVHGKTASGPLQDTLAELLEVNPSAATKLLESRDLFIMPNPPN